ncbi:hypothetical protein Riv7116_4188 [Rivularia sp. PCC 7116]|uniref:outer membrane protein n=1 Tax=Rivularia sp. PCC 7116 TaxID=373994 RepID=UPI00029ED006|nr:hypothetical protein [Rivularia sp. PCC 7116]AFY56620.1 hypothetical protein Riv7116_4188 [Rivularia sp. PCC 7116]
MNKIFLRKSVFSLSLAAISLLSSSLSASAQTVEKTIEQQFVQSDRVTSKQENTPVEHFSSSFANQDSEKSHLLVNPELVTPKRYTQKSQNTAPVPGTTVTSSAALASQSQQASSLREHPQANQKISDSSQLAQADIDFGGSTRGGSSYIGVAGNIGLGGDSALGDGNFMVISKVGLTDILSVRPSVVLGDDTVILVPLTYDFSFKQVADPFREPLPFSPYAGAGLAYATGDDSELTFLLTGGVDVPITDKLTATAAVNAAFFDETDLGLSVGVGYNFGGF